MEGQTKSNLIAAVLVLIVLVLAAWYAATRQKHYTYTALSQIEYTPATGTPPFLTFTFAQPLVQGQVVGTTATLLGFTVSENSPTPPSVAQPLINAILQKLPFVPTLGLAQNTVASNTLPSGVLPTGAMKITGLGAMRFVVPRRQ